MRPSLLLAAALAACVPAAPAFAWGATGHRLIGQASALSLPSEVPAFLKTPAAVEQLGELAREPDRSKGAGQPHDVDSDPGHFVDVDEAGTVLGGPSLAELPLSREAYGTAVRAAGIDPVKAGWLPYSIMDGWQQLAKDFGYWRVDRLGERVGKTRAERAWYARDRVLREQIIVRDLGVWSHYVGDGSQPMHASIHYNGWGDYPNPEGFTREKVHGPFEGAFVHANITLAAVRGAMPAFASCEAEIRDCVSRYLLATTATVIPFYRLEKAGGFRPADARGRAFALERVAAGAAQLRDLTVMAWRASGDSTVGYPALKVRDLEAARAIPFENMLGID